MSIITIPFSWLLLQLYYLFSNYGLALIAFALVISLIRLPFDYRGKKSMMRTSLLTPQLNKLKERHGENTPKYNEEMQKLYKQEKINPLSGCLWNIIPLVIVMILYQVVRKPLTYTMGLSNDQITLITDTLKNLGANIDFDSVWSQMYIAQNISQYYEQIKEVVPEVINLSFNFAGLKLGSIPSYEFWNFATWSFEQRALFFIPVVSAGLSAVSQKLAMSTSFQQQQQQSGMGGTMKGMMIFGPVLALWMGYSFPAAIGIYWLSTNFLNMVFTFFINREIKSEYERLTRERDAAMAAKEAELEAKRLETERLKALNATTENPNTSKKNKKKTEKQKQEERQAAEKKKESGTAASGGETSAEPSREGKRPYARGRAYEPDRFDGTESNETSSDEQTTQDSTIHKRKDTEPEAQNTQENDPWAKQPKPGPAVDAVFKSEGKGPENQEEFEEDSDLGPDYDEDSEQSDEDCDETEPQDQSDSQ